MSLSRVRVLMIAGLFAAGCAGCLAQSNTAAKAVSRRPANVPATYVITPFGYFHPSCVQSLAKGEKLLADGRLQHADGTASEHAAVCSYARYTATGSQAGAALSSASPEISGWVEDANTTTGSATASYGGMLAVWTVPPPPLEDDGQVLYFFPGLVDLNTDQSILQPVLGWYQGQWTIASWNCCLSGIVTSSPPVVVAARDVIYGSITSTCPAGTLSCSTWNVLTLDLSNGQSTTLAGTPSDGQIFNWAFGGVLEAYYVDSCKDYPPNHSLRFDFVTIFDQNLHPIHQPEWTAAEYPATPECHYNVRTKPGEITIAF